MPAPDRHPIDERRIDEAMPVPDVPGHTRAAPTSTPSQQASGGAGEQLPRLLSADDVARLFDRTARTIRNWTRHGHLVPVRIGRSVFYREDDIRTLIVTGGKRF